MKLNPSIHFPEHHAADALKKKIRQPHPKVRREGRGAFERLCEDDESVVNCHQHQCHGDANICLAAVRTDSQGDADQCKANARKRKGDLLVELHFCRGGVRAVLFCLGDALAKFALANGDISISVMH